MSVVTLFARSTTTNPTAAYSMVFWPVLTFSGSPEDVISVNPPHRTMIAQIGTASTEIKLIIFVTTQVASLQLPPKGFGREIGPDPLVSWAKTLAHTPKTPPINIHKRFLIFFIPTPIGESHLFEAHTPLICRRLLDFGNNVS